jgi:hypothetical protein
MIKCGWSRLLIGAGMIGMLIVSSPKSSPAQENDPPLVIMAGVPKYLGETRDYDLIFSTLAEAGVTAFLPTSQYQKLPEPLALDIDADFFPPCDFDGAPFAAMRKHGVKLLAAADVLYPPGQFPPLDDDPLLKLIECAGDGQVWGVLSYDEPAWSGRNLDDVRVLYERVKQVAPDLPVLMAHAPRLIDGEPPAQAEIDDYFNHVAEYSVYADMVGFDLYPIPPEIAAILAPGYGQKSVPYAAAFPAYLNWLSDTTGKPVFMALQGFSYRHLVDDATAQQAEAAGFVLRPPSSEELRTMACLTVNAGGGIAWWGQSHLTAADTEFWTALLDVTHQVITDPAGYCAGVGE